MNKDDKNLSGQLQDNSVATENRNARSADMNTSLHTGTPEKERRRRQIAVIQDEAAVLNRENMATAREDAADLREEKTSLRERKVMLVETMQAMSDEHMQMLQEVNASLVIATVNAQILAEELLAAKTELVTARIVAENARAVAEKANLAKSEFLSSMSHELRTPLNAILGFAQLLDAGTPRPTATQNSRLQQIIKAGWYLLELINEILDLAVIESGKIALSQDSVMLADVLRECLSMIEPQAKSHAVQVNFQPSAHRWFTNTDRIRLKQVLINLLSNAVKYNREHGTIDVTCSASGPDRVRISIRDSGEGLPAEKLAQLFQPFNRLGQESGNTEGTGIGLVVTKQLVELMGGNIGADSTPGVGSVFWIELNAEIMADPAAKNDSPADDSAQPQNSTTRHYTVLYVEDNPANLMLVEQIISSHAHIRMLGARDGKHGLVLARALLPDVILLDINLPDISGLEVLRLLRADPTTSHIQLIALSANAMLHDMENALKAGFMHYLTKPIKINELMAALENAQKLSAKGPDNTNESEKIT
ncbi:MAG: hypothetical protein B7Y56_15810 [Gallionellales bacterium 35-53-114]|jgi:signal transduction histidine kinase/ActR/RegA family two-component response regulator|nr:MAG: hypothetical protein B7Y56_15810 [Gallionellales bacterium 35-53-114]OYZ62041.1 MAG: hypothetical protein B7Y04_15775 [Gallionellales bacterium 24-53-125]OZB07133.1 MAG: hypothetical protein B7X61_15735 [Gallionellales bacterium 39-52-133]HQS58455.1 ATP-binding protein [Gallionellaceae bacterium]HQS74796.1 ATP-binding protein [Gallionellaceae bacterium]